jgi:intraflagellar transport protein 88
MHEESLRAYRFIVQQKAYSMGGRLHVNIGNIYFEQEKYQDAIKHYQMALDQVAQTSQELRYKIQRNLATCHLRLFKFPEAANALAQIMENSPEPRAAINLMVCYFAMGEKDKMMTLFAEMIALRREMQVFFKPSLGSSQSNSLTLSAAIDGVNKDDDSEPNDELKIEKNKRRQFLDSKIISAAQLIAPVIAADFQSGFDWVLKSLCEGGSEDLASQLEMVKALQFMKQKHFDKAIETLKSFERKDQSLASSASTNLSFLYFLEGDYKNAESYADAAITADKLNARAVVNKGNCLAMKDDLQGAIKCFLEALGMDYSCVEAFYNLGLAHKKLGKFDIALKSFQKVTDIIGTDRDVTFQMAQLYFLGSVYLFIYLYF